MRCYVLLVTCTLFFGISYLLCVKAFRRDSYFKQCHGKELSNVFETYAGLSKVKCAEKCQSRMISNACSGANYNKQTGECGLSNDPSQLMTDTDVNHFVALKLQSDTVHDCTDILRISPEATSGVYYVTLPVSGQSQPVYCDMDGWTVFQRRQDGSVDFYLGWEDYVEGFGDPNGEFWMGLETLYRILSNAPNDYELRVDLESFEGEKRYAEYSTFYIDDAADKYRLHVGGYSGDAGDSLTNHDSMPFMTKEGNNCAVRFTGAWWYKTCHLSNLNGVYYPDGTTTTIYAKHVVWQTWKGHYVSLQKTEMKIRRKG